MDRAREIQFEIWRKAGPGGRLAIAAALNAFVRSVWEQRLRRQFPEASEQELRWARLREVLHLPPGTTPP